MIKTYGFDSYNQMISEETSPSIRASEGGDTKPKILVIKGKDDESNRD